MYFFCYFKIIGVVLWLTLIIISSTKQSTKGKWEKKKNFEPGPESVLFLALFQVTIPNCWQLTSRRNTVWIKMFPCHLLTFFISELTCRWLCSCWCCRALCTPSLSTHHRLRGGLCINQPVHGSPWSRGRGFPRWYRGQDILTRAGSLVRVRLFIMGQNS